MAFELGGLEHDYRLVSFDQRGTGSSGLIRCPALERDPRVRSTRAGEACALKLGARRGLYGTRDSVEDIEALRRALGVDKLTLFGISYGTKLALAYARAHPDHVARIALDSVADPDEDDSFGLEPYRAMAATLKALCPGRCVSADPAADLARLVERLRRAPMRGLVYRLRARAAAGDADRARALRPDVRLRLQPGRPRRDPGRRAGGARPRRPGAAAAARAQRVGALHRSRGRGRSRPRRYAAVCEETPLPWPRNTPFGEREGLAQAEADRAGPARVLPVRLRRGVGGRDRSVPALGRRVAASRARRRLPGGAGADPPGRGGPADAAGRSPRGWRRGCRARRAWSCRGWGTRWWAATRRAAACGGCWRSCTGGGPRRRAGAWRLWSRPRRCSRGRWGRSRPRAACRGGAGRTVAALDATLDDLTFALSPALGSPLAGPGLRGGSFRLRPPRDRPAPAAGGPRRAGERRAAAARERPSAPVRAARRPRAGCASRRAGRCGGGWEGRRVRGRLRAGPPRPVAGGARAVTSVSR